MVLLRHLDGFLVQPARALAEKLVSRRLIVCVDVLRHMEVAPVTRRLEQHHDYHRLDLAPFSLPTAFRPVGVFWCSSFHWSAARPFTAVPEIRGRSSFFRCASRMSSVARSWRQASDGARLWKRRLRAGSQVAVDADRKPHFFLAFFAGTGAAGSCLNTSPLTS